MKFIWTGEEYINPSRIISISSGIDNETDYCVNIICSDNYNAVYNPQHEKRIAKAEADKLCDELAEQISFCLSDRAGH